MSEETVVGWDGTPAAHRALDWALSRAEARGENVLIAHVLIGDVSATKRPVAEPVIREAETALERARQSAQSQHPRLSIGSQLLFGDPAEELRSLSDRNTLLVVGTHSTSDSGANEPWSLGARLAALAYGPVAIIPDGHLPSDGERAGVVAGVDGSAASLAAAQYAAGEAVRRGEILTTVHAWQVPPMWQDTQLDDDALQALEEVHRGILNTTIDHVQREFPTLTIAKQVVKLPAMTALHDASAKSRLLVLGNHGLKVAPRLALGPVSHSMVRKVDVPTVIVRDAELIS